MLHTTSIGNVTLVLPIPQRVICMNISSKMVKNNMYSADITSYTNCPGKSGISYDRMPDYVPSIPGYGYNCS